MPKKYISANIKEMILINPGSIFFLFSTILLWPLHHAYAQTTIKAPSNVCVSGNCAPSTSTNLGYGPGPLSGLEWRSGHWVNGDSDRNIDFEIWRGRKADSITQSMPGRTYWYQHAGCSSESAVDQEFSQTPQNFRPSFEGIFDNTTAWKSHIWGGYPATEHRKKLIHLGWMDAIPSSVGNGNMKNPKLWRDVKNGSGDKYYFLLGRKFAYLDQMHGDPAFPMSFDLTYEWTLVSHPQFPGGGYTIDGVTYHTYQDFPYGWARLVKVFKEGYKYQRGKDCPYRFTWRPQLRFYVTDANGNTIRHEKMWPNDISSWNIPTDVKINGIKVLSSGPIGKQADILCLSFHDSGPVKIQGASLTSTGSTWSQVLNGNSSYWGLQVASDFAKLKNVPLCMPEWSPRRGDMYTSTHPGDVIRMMHYFLKLNKTNLAYENLFDQGDGNPYTTWDPPVPLSQDPATVYLQLWK